MNTEHVLPTSLIHLRFKWRFDPLLLNFPPIYGLVELLSSYGVCMFTCSQPCFGILGSGTESKKTNLHCTHIIRAPPDCCRIVSELSISATGHVMCRYSIDMINIATQCVTFVNLVIQFSQLCMYCNVKLKPVT